MNKVEPCKDHDALAEVWLASVRATHNFLREQDVEFYYRKLHDEYLPSVALYAIRDDNGRWCAFAGISGDMVEMLFVRPDMMGHGYGSALLEFAVGEMKCRKVDVNEQNGRALDFYRGYGFSIIGREAVDSEGKPYPILHLVL